MSEQPDSSSFDNGSLSRESPVLAQHVAAIRGLQTRLIGDVVEIGRRLCECKAILRHGEWQPWLKREFDLSERTARNFMSAYRFVVDKSANVADLQIEVSSLYLIAPPSVPEEVQAEVLRKAAASAVSPSEVKAMVMRGSEKRRVSIREAIEGLDVHGFTKLPSIEQAKILEEKPERRELAIRDAQIRQAWEPRYRDLQAGLSALESAAKAPMKKLIIDIPAADRDAVLTRVKRATKFLDRLEGALTEANTTMPSSADEESTLNLLLSGSRRKYGRL